jgi:cell division protein FtsW
MAAARRKPARRAPVVAKPLGALREKLTNRATPGSDPVRASGRRTAAKRPGATRVAKRAGKAAKPAAATEPIEYRLLLTATMCLLAAGAVMVYSASSSREVLQGGGNGYGYLAKYVIFGAIGFAALHALRRMPLERVRQAAPLLLLISFAGLIAVRLPGIGITVNGAKRWVGVGPIQFQPSELMKLSLVLYAVNLLATRPRQFRTLKGLVNPLLLVAGAAALLVASQPDLGTALVIAFVLATLLIAAGVPTRNLMIITGWAVGAILLFAIIEPYRRARLTSFLHPWADAGGSGFQSVQGQIALGSGGFFGVGLGQSVQKVFYLPEAHTDFILAVIGEELGIAGVMGLLFLYGTIAYAGLRTAKAAVGEYAKLLAVGITALIVCQAMLNVFTVLGLAPLTGVPLPFISSGSSSLMVMLAAMGLLLNIASGASVKLRAVPSNRKERDAATRGDRGRRDRRARRAGAGGRRRAAG